MHLLEDPRWMSHRACEGRRLIASAELHGLAGHGGMRRWGFLPSGEVLTRSCSKEDVTASGSSRPVACRAPRRSSRPVSSRSFRAREHEHGGCCRPPRVWLRYAIEDEGIEEGLGRHRAGRIRPERSAREGWRCGSQARLRANSLVRAADPNGDRLGPVRLGPVPGPAARRPRDAGPLIRMDHTSTG